MKFDRVLPSVILLELVIEVIEASNEAKLVEISVATFSVTTVGILVQFQVGDVVVSSENKIYDYFESFLTISLHLHYLILLSFRIIMIIPLNWQI